MKKVVFICIFILLFCVSLKAQDSVVVYSTDYLDGEIMYSENGDFYTMSTISLGFITGDWVQYNSYDRGYISFDLPLILFNDNTEIDSAEVGVYLYNGLSNIGDYSYPIWDVPSGDTLYCIMDLIDYGTSLDTLDWTAGDPGDPQTIVSNIGVLCSYFNIGFQKMRVGPYIETLAQEDYERCQFRVRFPINTDYDNHWDFLCFYASDIGIDYPERKPYLKIFYHINAPVSDDQNYKKGEYTISAQPNPFSTSTTISYNATTDYHEFPQIKIYNIKGQLIKTITSFPNPSLGTHKAVWDGKDERGKDVKSGVYFYKLDTKSDTFINKLIKLK